MRLCFILVTDIFRQRLDEVIRRQGVTRSAFAELTGIDRSTLSQLLSAENRRLPRVETLTAIARHAQVSIDWLLGLSHSGPMQAEMIEEQTAFAPGGIGSDERLAAWFVESVGYKVRYVPSTIPDLLKTDPVIRFELNDHVSASATQSMETAAARLAWTRAPDTEMECCSSIQSLQSFARGEGIWSKLRLTARLQQLDQMAALSDELYPALRWFLFDGLQRYSAPVTIFGPLRAALYLGQQYLVLTSAEHVRTLSRHFDDLIRGAVVQPPAVPDLIARLRRDAKAG